MYRLIIVDDEEIIREGLLCGVNWSTLGFEAVRGFESGEDALAWIEDGNTCDAVLTDIMMAGMSGLELAGRLHESHPEIRVLILSAYQEFEYARTALREGVTDYLLKPLSTSDIRQVFAKLRAALDREAGENRALRETQGGIGLLARVKSFVQMIDENRVGALRETLEAYVREAERNAAADGLEYARFLVKSLLSGIEAEYRERGTDVQELTGGHWNSVKVLEASDEQTLREAAGFMLETLTARLHGKSGDSPNFMIHRIEQYIREHLAEDVSVEKLARIAHMNPSYFGRYFRKNTGEALGDYVLRLRIECAKELLRGGRHRTEDIARLAGFSSAKYFYAQFKKATGYTMTEYCRVMLPKEKER